MFKDLHDVLKNRAYRLYTKSIRQIGSDAVLFTAKRNEQKLVGIAGDRNLPGLNDPIDVFLHVKMYALTWGNYQQLTKIIHLVPSPCNAKASFGTGDRMGMVTAAHLDVDGRYPIFPVIAQQSPRELERTGRTFKSVLLDAAMGVLEFGWTAPWGADADHIKDEARFMEGIEAGYTMYTLDVSDDLQNIDGFSSDEIAACAENLSDESKKIIQNWTDKTIAGYSFSEAELAKSAVVYEKSMQRVERFNSIAKSRLAAYDLEVSIDEGSRDTTPEDHLFVVEYLHRAGVDFTSLAPKFPGEFQKAIDFIGDCEILEKSFKIHSELARKLQGYRLSLHSGSDKFSVYKMFSNATNGNYHIKTSGTSWLQAINLIVHKNPELFEELYAISLKVLPESKKAYHVYITPQHFPVHPMEDFSVFFAKPDAQQLFHISYGALLNARRDEIVETLKANELDHYNFVSKHIDRHLRLLFAD